MANQCKACTCVNAAKVLTEIWSHTTETTWSNFQQKVLKLSGGDVLTDGNQVKVKIMQAQNVVTFNDVMTLVDTSAEGWQAKIAFIVENAKAGSNAAKLDELRELTLRSLECRPITKDPVVYSTKIHHNFRNYIRTEWTYWYTSQGFTAALSCKHLHLAFGLKGKSKYALQRCYQNYLPMEGWQSNTPFIGWLF